jgi:hypothetical protein
MLAAEAVAVSVQIVARGISPPARCFDAAEDWFQSNSRVSDPTILTAAAEEDEWSRR